MSSLKTKHRSALALLAGVLLVLSGVTAADAVTARAVSLKASPTLQYAGSAVTFSGNVSKSGAGAVLKLQRKSGTTWVAAGQTHTTTAQGAYSVKLNLPTTAAVYVYRALAPRTTAFGGAYSPQISVTAVRHTAASIGASPTTIPNGSSSTLSGSVAPFVAGTVVTIQSLSGSTWVSGPTATLSASGAFSTPVSPTATTSYRVAVPRAGLNAATSSSPVTVTVGAAASPPTILTTTLPEGDKGIAYSAPLTKAGGAGTWTVSAGLLNAGISLNPSTGVLAGTPTAGGTATFTVKFTETATNLSDTQALTLVVSPPPAITTTALPNAARGVAYSTTLSKTGRDGTWSISGLPSGLALAAATGVISGTTAAAAGTYGVYPVFTETSTGRQVLKPLALTVVEGAPNSPVITTTTLPDADKGIAYSTTLVRTGGAGTWSVTGGALPAGITLAAGTGVLSGTPTAGGTASFTVTFTETVSGLSDSQALTLLVTPPPAVTTTTLPDATRAVAYSATLAHSGKAGTWAISGLPAGLSLNSATGAITGTSSVVTGTYGVYPVFTETSTGRQAAAALALHVVGGDPVITTTSVPVGITGTAYNTQLAKTGLTGTWSVKQGNLPDGITLSPAGLLSGTPTTVGDYGFTVTFTETSTGYSDNQVYLLHVEAPGSPQITTGSILPDGTVGTPYTTTVDGDGTGTWTLVYDILPPGTSLDSATGVISGTPITAGDFVFVLKYTTATGSNTKVFGIHIAATP